MINKLFFWLAQIFFFLMLVIPASHQAWRGMLLAVLLLAVALRLMRMNTWKLHKDIYYWGLLCVTASLLFMLNGAIHNGPGALEVGTVYVVWPLLYLFLSGFLNRPEQLAPFTVTLLAGAISAAMLGVMFVLQELAGFDFGISSLVEDQGGTLGSTDDFIKFSLPNLTTVIYALPFLLGQLMLPQKISNLEGKRLVFTWIGLLLAVIVLLISARKAFWVISALSPFVILIIFRLCNIQFDYKKIMGKAIAIFAFAVVVMSISGVSFESNWDHMMSGFEFADPDNISANTRLQQFVALLQGWMENPILGAGHGMAASGFEFRVKDMEFGRSMPWGYELSYVALLFHTGLIGILVYGSAVVWLFVRGIATVRRQPEAAGMLIPLLSALVGFLIANATNPYLEKFDYLWTLFLPVAVLNAYLLKSKQSEIHSL
jgi:hypothetical protein